MKAVLILTAGFGEGHNAAARNLAEGIRASQPDAKVEIHDIYAEAYGWVNRISQKMYLFVINHFPFVWKLVFDILDRTNVLGGGIGIFGRAARTLHNLLDSFQPDVVVSTYPGNGFLLDQILAPSAGRPFRTVTVVTDSLSINSVWYKCYSDDFLVPNEATADVMRLAGVPEGKIHSTGFPVPLVFATQNSDRQTPPPDGRWQVLYMVNSGHHLAADVLRALLPLKNIALTVTVGREAALGEKLRLQAEAGGREIEIFGWTAEIPRLIRRSHLLISKAGGATVQESLAARTPMVITQIIPGQEEGNARLLIDCGSGELATTPDAIAAVVRRVFEDGGKEYVRRYEAGARWSYPDASYSAARFVLTGETPVNRRQ